VYLETFLPVPGETLEALACLFAASTAYKAAMLAKKRGTELPEAAVFLGKHAAPLAEAAGLGRPLSASGETVAAVMKGAGDFEIRSLFTGFLRFLLDHVSLSPEQLASPALVSYNELWKECAARAGSAVAVYNQSPSLALERFFTEASRGMAAL
jgi:DNA polymerase-3 subunit gamma/tau